jgi:hypothetical protein
MMELVSEYWCLRICWDGCGTWDWAEGRMLRPGCGRADPC